MKTGINDITNAAGLFIITMGFLVLAVWIFNISENKSEIPDMISMRLKSGICFILCGIGFSLPMQWKETRTGKTQLALFY